MHKAIRDLMVQWMITEAENGNFTWSVRGVGTRGARGAEPPYLRPVAMVYYNSTSGGSRECFRGFYWNPHNQLNPVARAFFLVVARSGALGLCTITHTRVSWVEPRIRPLTRCVMPEQGKVGVASQIFHALRAQSYYQPPFSKKFFLHHCQYPPSTWVQLEFGVRD